MYTQIKALLICTFITTFSFGQMSESVDEITITPVEHASLILETKYKRIFVDPVGHEEIFNTHGTPDIVLLTDIHGDHMNAETLNALHLSKSIIIAPKAVAEALPENLQSKIQIVNNDEKVEVSGVKIEAIPMYNLREEAKSFHTKGRGNGYVLKLANKKIYISGDTEDIPEMRNLHNIDIAFVCMNLPYTMTIDSAADAVLDFKPGIVYPYHFRGKNGKSDVKKFSSMVTEENEDIDVRILNWYPEK
ncbi:L-ascorbate metabolism protein UlaG, beta-lactamase superfamily [Pustulibacterium marinum]|uniref:L-ascorbate metabolism protein UlaG, beta-lactamase superfamily n=1 Tax=Pustulibacterium marinum TaxID=1224947 RepID=A0A1I7IJS4_9FLAO|nr:MBL fold metallo-hydrolase [Pustulibacterium marinum]SFU73170.1 L-ascorbate metabolism protein UlaG, beta-lactamase superfamily [Pustulibacterium marinum]